MRNLNFGLLILVLISAAVIAGCSNNPNSTDPAANSRPGNSNIAANGGPQNSAVSNNGPATDAGNDEYPQSVTDEFVAACEGTGAKRDDCECVFEKVKQQYTFDQFSEIESKINAGEPADEFVRFSEKARAECLK